MKFVVFFIMLVSALACKEPAVQATDSVVAVAPPADATPLAGEASAATASAP